MECYLVKSKILLFSIFSLIFISGCGNKTIEPGEYVVGKDMKPGVYRVEPTNDGDMSIFVFGSEVAMSKSPLFVEVSEDQKVEFSETTTVKSYSKSTKNKPKDGVYKNDMYLVGRDIDPGEYVFEQVSTSETGWVYFYKDLNYTTFSEIDSNYVKDGGQKAIKLRDGDYILLENVLIKK